MRRILLCCVLLMSHIGAAIAAVPGERSFCLDPAGLWCFGTMTMRVDKLIATGAVFNNGEELLPGRIGFKFSMEAAPAEKASKAATQ